MLPLPDFFIRLPVFCLHPFRPDRRSSLSESARLPSRFRRKHTLSSSGTAQPVSRSYRMPSMRLRVSKAAPSTPAVSPRVERRSVVSRVTNRSEYLFSAVRIGSIR